MHGVVISILKRNIAISLYYFFIGFILAFVVSNSMYINNISIISNRFYSKNALAFMIVNAEENDISILCDLLQPNHILWKENTTNNRGIYYNSGINLPIVKGKQFEFQNGYLLDDKNSILSGKDCFIPNMNQTSIGTLGLKNTETSLNNYFFYPIDKNFRSINGKWVLDGSNPKITLDLYLKSPLAKHIYIAEIDQNFSAYKIINTSLLYGLTFFVIFSSVVMVGILWFEKKNHYISICRISGIPMSKIRMNLICNYCIFLIFAAFSSSVYFIVEKPEFVFENYMFQMILYFFISLVINFVLILCITFAKSKRWIGDDEVEYYHFKN